MRKRTLLSLEPLEERLPLSAELAFDLDTRDGSSLERVTNVVEFNGLAYFAGISDGDIYRLWKSDGTRQGTLPLPQTFDAVHGLVRAALLDKESASFTVFGLRMGQLKAHILSE